MSKSEAVAEILDHCLQRIQRGESTLEQCVRDHPDLAHDLRPLLLAAARAREQLSPAGPTAQYRASSRARVLNLTRAYPKRRLPAKPPRTWLAWRPAYALSALLLMLALLGGSVSLAYASGQALPGDPLYGLKRGIEQAALVISPSAAGDARLLLRHAERRVEELQELLEADRLDDLEPAISGYRAALDQALALSGTDLEQLVPLDEALGRHETALLAVLERVPAQAVPAISDALEHTGKARRAVEEILGGEHPSDSAPGQLKKSDDEDQGHEGTPPGQLMKLDGEDDRVPPGQKNKNGCLPDDPKKGPPSGEDCLANPPLN